MSSKNTISEVYEIDSNSKFFLRNFNFTSLLQKRQEQIEESPTIFVSLLNICEDNIKKHNWADQELNNQKTNIESILSILQLIKAKNVKSQIFKKMLIYSYNDKNLQLLGDDKILKDDCSTLAKSLLSTNKTSRTSHIIPVLYKLLNSLDSQYLEFFSSISKSGVKRMSLGDKKKVSVRIFISMGSFDQYDKKELWEVLEAFKTIFDIVINPINLSNDLLASRVCSNFNEFSFTDFKCKSFTVNESEQYLNYIKNLSGIKQEFDLSILSEKLFNLGLSIKDEQFASMVDSQIVNLKKVYETLLFHQKNERSKIREIRENAESQIKLAKEYISVESQKLNKFLSDQKSLIDQLNAKRKDIEQLTQSISEIKNQISIENVDCSYYRRRILDIERRLKVTANVIDSFTNLKLIY